MREEAFDRWVRARGPFRQHEETSNGRAAHNGIAPRSAKGPGRALAEQVKRGVQARLLVHQADAVWRTLEIDEAALVLGADDPAR